MNPQIREIRETVENDMMNLLKFTFKVYVMNEAEELLHDIAEDEFWNKWFLYNAVLLISPVGWEDVNDPIIPTFLIQNVFQSSEDDLISIIQEDHQCSDLFTKDDNIGCYLYFTYNNIYKDRIRQWAEDEFLFSPK